MWGKLLKLDDDVEVWPGHDYGVRPSSTIGDERREKMVTVLIRRNIVERGERFHYDEIRSVRTRRREVKMETAVKSRRLSNSDERI